MFDVIFVHNGKEYPMHKFTFRVGRSNFCDMVFTDRFVSKIHFCVQRSSEQLIFCDGDMQGGYSTNGSIVDGVSINKGNCVYLKDGSLIQIEYLHINVKLIERFIDPSKSTRSS